MVCERIRKYVFMALNIYASSSKYGFYIWAANRAPGDIHGRLNFTAQQPFGELLRLQKRKIYPKQL